MNLRQNTLCVIPARGGSKGVPGKNIRLLGGKPLIAHTIEAAQTSRSLSRVVVSTDDPEIAAVAQKWGAEIPFMRPPELARDNTPMLAVVIHAFQWFEKEVSNCETVVVLQPTSPFRPSHFVDQAITQSEKEFDDVVISLAKVHQHPHWMKHLTGGIVQPYTGVFNPPSRRQDLPPVYAMNGSLFLVRREALLRRQTVSASYATQFSDERMGAVLVEGINAVDIDTELDFKFAELIACEMATKATTP